MVPQLHHRPHAAAQLTALPSQPWSPCPPADYALSRFNESLSLVLLDASDYDAIYIADGHGLMWDGPYNSEIKRLVEEAWVGASLLAQLHRIWHRVWQLHRRCGGLHMHDCSRSSACPCWCT